MGRWVGRVPLPRGLFFVTEHLLTLGAVPGISDSQQALRFRASARSVPRPPGCLRRPGTHRHRRDTEGGSMRQRMVVRQVEHTRRNRLRRRISRVRSIEAGETRPRVRHPGSGGLESQIILGIRPP